MKLRFKKSLVLIKKIEYYFLETFLNLSLKYSLELSLFAMFDPFRTFENILMRARTFERILEQFRAF